MFGTPSSTPAFGTPSSTPAFGTPSSTPLFGTPSSTPAFGTPSTPAFASGGFGSSLFSTPFTSQTQQQQQQQQQTPFFQQPSASGFGFQQQQQQTPFATPLQMTPFPTPQLTTQMAPVAPLPFSLADRDIQAIVDAYKEEPGNPKYAFKYLLLSVTDPQHRVKPAGVSEIMWAEAMAKLEGMDSADRERLWPQLVQGFKDLSNRLKVVRSEFEALMLLANLMQLQDEVIVSDAERLRMTQSNVKMLQRHFQAETLPWIERMRQKEQSLQRRLLRVRIWLSSSELLFNMNSMHLKFMHPVLDNLFQHLPSPIIRMKVMRIMEALEGKGCRLPLTKGEAELAEKLVAIIRQAGLKGSGAEFSRRVHNLLTVSRVQANGIGAGGSLYLPGSTKIHEESLADMQEVLQQQTEAIARLGNVLKRDIRDMEIMMAEDT
ncbi:hypothetical protein POTOM_037561 [Populus tomentosa]|uniref:Nucleoporin Nup54 alpha-helical domain-containing protein n=1 Tax=Populus tomentosa TaxID=118781 RepID=A0A8X8CKL2_POPTO|nr:hypothetical protein POTOM_037561 [Populus tomentosa]